MRRVGEKDHFRLRSRENTDIKRCKIDGPTYLWPYVDLTYNAVQENIDSGTHEDTQDARDQSALCNPE